VLKIFTDSQIRDFLATFKECSQRGELLPGDFSVARQLAHEVSIRGLEDQEWLTELLEAETLNDTHGL
jgi:hypothetical protein